MTDFIRRTTSGYSPHTCMFFLLCLAGTSLTAQQKLTKTVATTAIEDEQHKTIYTGQVTFLGEQRDRIAMCNPSSFAAFTEISTRTNNGYCFCCVEIPRTSQGKPIYPSRFPRQFPGKKDIPALAVFTSDTGRLSPSNSRQSEFSSEVFTDQSSNEISKITAAATKLLKPINPELWNYKWEPSTVVKMSWKDLSKSEKSSAERNSYDLYIAINGKETIAIYNFSEIAWVPPTDELQVGFNAGNDFDFIQLSLPADPQQLPKFSEAAGGPGQLMVRISSVPPLRLGCIHDIAGTYQLMVLPEYNATFLGGEVLTVSGPCLKSATSYWCNFDLFGTKLTTEAKEFGNKYYLKCAVPRFNRTGVANLTLQTRENSVATFQASITIVRPSEKKPRLVLSQPSDWTQRVFPEGGLEIKWEKSDFETKYLTLSVLGYSEAEEVAKEDHFKVMKDLQVENTGVFLLKPENFHCKDASNCAHHHIGYLSLAGNDRHKVNRTIWSSLIPLAWFANSALTESKGRGWADAKCEKFEPQPPPYRWTDVSCPCSLEEVQINVNQFVETNDCPTIAGGCSKAVPQQRCFKTILPKGSEKFFLASICCFSTKDGFLLYSEDIGFDAKGNHGSRASLLKPSSDLPELSFYVRESLNFFYCCVWNQQAKFCPYFNLRRPTPNCRSFANGGLGATIGDPHIISFGNQRYTLNPVGDHVLLRSEELEVQARFAKLGVHDEVTFLTAAAFRAGDVKICVLLQSAGGFHVAFRNGTKIDIQSGKFSIQGVRINKPTAEGALQVLIASGNQSIGLMMQRQQDSNYMNMETSISKALQGKTVGLLGRWQRFQNVSFMVRSDGTPFKPWTPTEPSTLKELADIYRVKSEKDSLFWYRPPWTFASVNPADDQDPSPTDVPYDKYPAFCENDKFCAFDYIRYNNDENVARTTLKAVQNFDGKMQKINSAVPSCGRPNVPAAVFNSHNFQAESEVEVTDCLYGDAYHLKKKLMMTCKRRPDGTYSWQPDPSETACEYVGEGDTQPTRAGLIAGLVFLFLLLLVLLVIAAFCFIRRRKAQEKKRPEKSRDRSQIPSQGPNPVPVTDTVKPYHYNAEESGDVYAFPVPNGRRSLERGARPVSQSSHQSSDAVDGHDGSPTQRRTTGARLNPEQEQVRQQLRQTLQVREDDDGQEDEEQQDALLQQPQYNQQHQPRQENPHQIRQQPPYNPQNPRQQPPYNPQNPRQQPPYNPQNPRQQPPYNPQNPRQQPPYNPQNPRQQPPYNPQNPRQQPTYNPQNPRQQPPYNPQQPHHQHLQQQAPRANMYQKRTGSGDYHYSPGRQSGGFVSSEATV